MLPSKNLEKSNFRKYAKAVRQTLLLGEMSQTICQNLQALSCFQEAHTIALYMPLAGEPDLVPLCSKFPEKNWLLPRVVANTEAPQWSHLVFCPYQSGDPLEQHAYGMWEPTATAPSWGQAIDLMLVPGLAFDLQGFRLGYGKGYYDRFIDALEPASRPILIGAVADALLVQNLPTDPWDIAMDGVVTEKQTLFPLKS